MIEDFFSTEYAKKSKFIWDFHRNKNIKERKNWLIYSSIFDKWFHSKKPENKKDLIPKKIHHIWLGEKKLPPYFEKFKKSWEKNNPDYELFFWDDENTKNLNLINRELFDVIENKGSKSDILRYEILYQYGGIYIDTDFECIKGIPKELLKKSFVACMQFDCKPEIGNSLLMSEPGTKLMSSIIKGCSYPKYETVKNIIEKTGPVMITNQINKFLESEKDNILILPSNYCFPVPNFLRDLDSPRNLTTDDSFAIHKWGTTWIETNIQKKLKIKIRLILKYIKSFFKQNLN